MDEFGENDMDFGGDDSGGDFNVGMDGNDTNIDSNPDTIADLENQGYDMNMEVTPGADNNASTEGETESGDEIPEDTSLTDVDAKWLDERDEEREKWTDGEVPQEVIDDNIESSTHNENAESITLGKYDGGGENSYINKAGDDSTIYSSENYEGIQDEYHLNDEEMYDVGNKQIVEDAVDDGKDIQFSHDPREADGAFGQEWDTIQEKTGANDDDLIEGDDGMLHLENQGTYAATDPVYVKDEKYDEDWN